jgi:hypothetical protein
VTVITSPDKLFWIQKDDIKTDICVVPLGHWLATQQHDGSRV